MLAIGQSYCPNCGAPIQPHAVFCPNCGTKITSSHPQPQQALPGYHPTISSQAPVSTGPYKAAIGILLVIIIILGVLSATSLGHLLPLTGNHYSLANPPSPQSVQPPNTQTAQPPYTTIWNACGASPSQGCNMTINGWREGTIPDTYDYFVSFTSTAPIHVDFFTLGQFVQFAVCNGDISCVSGSYSSIPATTSQSTIAFKLAEGCGDYVAIYVASSNGLMYPNISVKQNAAPFPTGYCAQVGGG